MLPLDCSYIRSYYAAGRRLGWSQVGSTITFGNYKKVWKIVYIKNITGPHLWRYALLYNILYQYLHACGNK